MADFIQNGGTNGGTYASHFSGILSVWENSYDIATNTSNVGYRLQLKSGSSGRFSGLTASYSVTINGTIVNGGSGTYNSQSYNTAQTICEGNVTITHNDDGSKTIGCSAVLDFQNHTYSPGDFTPSGNLILTTIPRASLINSFYGNDIEQYFSVNYTSYYSGFTNKLRLSIPNVKALETFNYSSGETFKLSDDTINYLYSYMSKIKTVKIGAVIETWNGSTKIGESVELINTCSITDCEPTIESASYLDSNTETTQITANNQQIIRNHSTVVINLTNLKSFKGATLDKCTATTNGINKSFSNITGTSIDSISLNFGTLDVSANSKITIVLTDSRGYTTTKELNISIINYIDLSINAVIKRTQPTTGEVDVTFSGNYYNGKLGNVDNSLTINWFYKERGAESWLSGGNITPIISDNTFNNGNTAISLGKIFDYQKSYEFYLQVVDKLITLKPTYIVTQGIPVFNWGKDFFNIFGTLKINEVSILELIFPIGSTYITQTDTNPNTILGFGTWERLKGKVCLGLDEDDEDFNTVGKTGGSKYLQEHKHTGTTSIGETDFMRATTTAGDGYSANHTVSHGSGSYQDYNGGSCDFPGANHYHHFITDNAGSGNSGNLQPYEVVGYMWIRRL